MQRQRLQPQPQPQAQTRSQAQPEPDREEVATGEQEVRSVVEEKLRHAGYLPPAPPPLLTKRTMKAFAEEARERLKALPANDEFASAFREAIAIVEQEVERDSKVALKFFDRLSAELTPSVPPFSRAKAIFKRLDAIIDRATISLEPPAASKGVAGKMRDVERFLAQEWAGNVERGVVAIYADEESQTTVVQIGIARYGPIYITVPRVLRPDDVALRSLRDLLGRLGAFHDGWTRWPSLTARTRL